MEKTIHIYFTKYKKYITIYKILLHAKTKNKITFKVCFLKLCV
jgi:hypothetical protein